MFTESTLLSVPFDGYSPILLIFMVSSFFCSVGSLLLSVDLTYTAFVMLLAARTVHNNILLYIHNNGCSLAPHILNCPEASI